MQPTPAADPAADGLPAALARLQALRARLAAECGAPVQLIETHISWVLLTPTQAYKLKKPLQVSVVDCGTLARRRFCCEEELRLNARLAPQIYLDLLPLADTPGGPEADVAVRMNRFADEALWSHRVAAGTLRPAHVEALAARLAAFQAAADVARVGGPYGTPATLGRIVGQLLDGLDAWQAAAPPCADWPPLRAWVSAQLGGLAPAFEARLQAGRVREGHGDLHLANLLAFDTPQPAATAFDGIDFEPALRWIDVLHDIAFVVMDLLAHGADALAWRFLNAWLDQTGDHESLPLLRFYLVSRALVRALVAALSAAQGRPAAPGLGTADYLALGRRLAEGADARLAITHGLPASGKSHVALALLQAAGAVRVRSDVERKRLHGLPPLASSRAAGQQIYEPASNARTYDRLRAVAGLGLQAGWPVIVDAAFLRRAERESFIALARRHRVPMAIIDCSAPLPVLEQRIAERQAQGTDPSEADAAVLLKLAAVAEPLTEAEAALRLPVDSTQPPASQALAADWRGLPPA